MNQTLPHETRQAASAEVIQLCHNLGLLLDKFSPWEQRGGLWNLWMDVINHKGEEKSLTGGAAKSVWLRDSPGNAISLPLFPSKHFDGELVKKAGERWTALVKSQNVEPFGMAVDYRLVVGFGAEHILETNLCLHRIYGFPIIPGSAVKGVTRAWAFWELAEKFQIRHPNVPQLELLLTIGTEKVQREIWQRMEVTAGFTEWQNESGDFYETFGTTKQQGQVIFFDAYPTIAPTLELDILNPHYGKYYSSGGKEPPADYDKPIPTYFLTVAKGSQFQFAVAAKPQLAAKAKQWLIAGLTGLGIGGKTSAGYGFMNEVR